MRRIVSLFLLLTIFSGLVFAQQQKTDWSTGIVTGIVGKTMFIDSRPYELTARTGLVLGGTKGKVTLKLDQFFTGTRVRYQTDGRDGKTPSLKFVELLAD